MGSKETDDCMLVPSASFTRLFDIQGESTVKHLQEAWPMAKSAFEEHGLSCALNMVAGSMTVSTTTKTRDPDIVYRAQDVLELLSVLIPFSTAKQILGNKFERAIFKLWSPSSALRKRYSTREFVKRWRYFMHEWERDFKENVGREHLYTALGCFMFVPEKFTVVVYGPHQGINVVRRFLLNCMHKRISPLEQLHDLKDISDIQGEVMKNLFEDFGVTSIMEAVSFMKESPVFREKLNESFAQALLKMQDATMLEVIADKCSSLDSPVVRANAADTLCAILKFAPPELVIRTSIRSLTGRLLGRALEGSWQKSVLINALSIFLSLLDPEVQLFEESDYICEHQNSHGFRVAAKSEILQSMLDNLGDLLKLLDDSSVDVMLLTSYGRLQPPLGIHRLKIVQLISVLLRVDSEAAEKQLICLGAVPRILDLLFKYPFNNFLHHHVEKIIESCLESKNSSLVHHVIHECDIVGKILEAEKIFTLATDLNKSTVPAKGRSPPRRGNIGHLTRISNKILELGNRNSEIQAYLQESEWTHWHSSVLSKRKAEDNVNQWSCGRPALLPDGGSGQERKRSKVVLIDIDGS